MWTGNDWRCVRRVMRVLTMSNSVILVRAVRNENHPQLETLRQRSFLVATIDRAVWTRGPLDSSHTEPYVWSRPGLCLEILYSRTTKIAALHRGGWCNKVICFQSCVVEWCRANVDKRIALLLDHGLSMTCKIKTYTTHPVSYESSFF